MRERERERERRSSSGSAYVQVAVAVAVHFPFRSPFSACLPCYLKLKFSRIRMLVLRFVVVVVAWSVMLHADVAVVDRQIAGRAAHTHTQRQGETCRRNERNEEKTHWQKGMEWGNGS